MSLQARKDLIADIEKDIGSILTVNQTKTVMDIIESRMASYNVESSYEYGVINTDLLKIFLAAKNVEGRSAKTIARYDYILTKLITGVGKPPEKITTNDIRAFLSEEKARGISDRSLEGLRTIYSSFFGWLKREELIRTNPTVNVGIIKCRKEIRLPYSAVEIEKLKDSCTTIRDRTIVNFLLSTGARISEVCALDICDIDFDKKECIVLGKGDKERDVFLNDVCVVSLKEYLASRTDKNNALFVGKKGRITPGGIRSMLKTLEKRSGVANVHPHRFRRTLASDLIKRGMSVPEVASILGHEKIDTTMRYVYLNKSDVKSSYSRFAN